MHLIGKLLLSLLSDRTVTVKYINIHNAYADKHIRRPVHVYTYISSHIRMHTYAHTFIHIYIVIFIYIYIYIQLFAMKAQTYFRLFLAGNTRICQNKSRSL